MGLTAAFLDAPRQVHEINLEPGDRVLLYTDGVTEARTQAGAEFGLDRFADSVVRATAAGEPAPETLRHLIHAVLDAQHNRLRDDATILLLEWRPPQPLPAWCRPRSSAEPVRRRRGRWLTRGQR